MDGLLTGEVQKIRENGATSGVGVLATYACDNLGRRSSLTRGNATVKSYSYDAVSRLSQMAEDLSGTSSDLTLGFSYNPASQITQTTRSNDAYAWGGHYGVDRSYTANGLNQYTASGSIAPTYDSKGNLASAGSTTYSYSSENRLVSATGGITLAYDPLLRLYQTAGGGAGTTRFAYDGAALIAEHNGSDSLLRRYVHGPGVDEPIVWYEGSGTSDRRFLHADERGSIVAVSNSAGATTALNAYDEYGIPETTSSRFLRPDPIGCEDAILRRRYGAGASFCATAGRKSRARPGGGRARVPSIPGRRRRSGPRNRPPRRSAGGNS